MLLDEDGNNYPVAREQPRPVHHNHNHRPRRNGDDDSIWLIAGGTLVALLAGGAGYMYLDNMNKQRQLQAYQAQQQQRSVIQQREEQMMTAHPVEQSVAQMPHEQEELVTEKGVNTGDYGSPETARDVQNSIPSPIYEEEIAGNGKQKEKPRFVDRSDTGLDVYTPSF